MAKRWHCACYHSLYSVENWNEYCNKWNYVQGMCRGIPLTRTRFFRIPCYFELKTISLGFVPSTLNFRLQFYLTENGIETLGTTISSVTTKFHSRVVRWLSKDVPFCTCLCTMTRIRTLFGLIYDGQLLTTSSFGWIVQNDRLRPELARIRDSSCRSGTSLVSKRVLIRYQFY